MRTDFKELLGTADAVPYVSEVLGLHTLGRQPTAAHSAEGAHSGSQHAGRRAAPRRGAHQAVWLAGAGRPQGPRADSRLLVRRAADGRREARADWAQAKGCSEAHQFPKNGARREQTCSAIQFICESDVIDDAAHAGFWMPLLDWNRYRHETYKENRDAELPYIRMSGEAAANAAPAPAAPAVSAKAAIYSEFKIIETGSHTQTGKDGSTKVVKCEYLKPPASARARRTSSR